MELLGGQEINSQNLEMKKDKGEASKTMTNHFCIVKKTTVHKDT